MSFKNPLGNIFRSTASYFAKAGKSFKTASDSISELLTFAIPALIKSPISNIHESLKKVTTVPIVKFYREFQSARKANIARKTIPNLNPKKLLPLNLQDVTDLILKEKYRYIFKLNVHYKDGKIELDKYFSLYSEHRLTPNDVMDIFQTDIFSTLRESNPSITHFTDFTLIVEQKAKNI